MSFMSSLEIIKSRMEEIQRLDTLYGKRLRAKIDDKKTLDLKKDEAKVIRDRILKASMNVRKILRQMELKESALR